MNDFGDRMREAGDADVEFQLQVMAVAGFGGHPGRQKVSFRRIRQNQCTET